jgi:glutamate/tyrosine decarboxylase-like PLP-dependent enzyme
MAPSALLWSFPTIERADSLPFDLHKWFSQPYGVGFIPVADGRALEGALSYQTAYTSRGSDLLTDSPVVSANAGPLPIFNILCRGSRSLSERALNRLTESLVSEIK